MSHGNYVTKHRIQLRARVGAFGLAGLAALWACSSAGPSASQGVAVVPDDASTSNAASGNVEGGANPAATSGSSGGGSSGGEAGSKAGPGPIEGIAPVKEIAANTESPGGYFDSVRQWRDAGLMFTDPTAGPGAGGILFQLANGEASPFRMPSNGSLGSAIDPRGGLVTAESNVGGASVGRVVRTLADGTYQVVADSWSAGVAVPFDSPNDVTVRKSDGTIYVTDPGYQNPDAGINHVFRISAAGAATVADSCDDLCRPNGIALSPDEKLLYVSFTGPFLDKSAPYIGKYAVAADGTLGPPSRFADVGPDVDGLASDDKGNVYAAFSGGVAVFDPNGVKWGVIAVPKAPTSVAFGDADRRTLYIASANASGPSLYTVRVNFPGRVE